MTDITIFEIDDCMASRNDFISFWLEIRTIDQKCGKEMKIKRHENSKMHSYLYKKHAAVVLPKKCSVMRRECSTFDRENVSVTSNFSPILFNNFENKWNMARIWLVKSSEMLVISSHDSAYAMIYKKYRKNINFGEKIRQLAFENG